MNSNAPGLAGDCARIRRLLPLAAHDLLDELDAAAVRAHLATCASCAAERAAYDRVESALCRYSRATASVAPLLTMDEIMRTVTRFAPALPARASALTRRTGARRMLAGLFASAAVLALIVLALAFFSSNALFTHYGGTGGNHALSPDVELRSISMISATDGWAVGDDDPVGKQTAMLLHYTGVRWEQVALPAGLDPTVSLNGISMVSTSDGWAVGATWPDTSTNAETHRAVLLHYTHGTWNVLTNTFSSGLTGVFMRTASDGWITGGGPNGGLLLHYDGASWQQVTAPALAGFRFNVGSVAPVSASDVWITALGPAVNGIRPASSILHFDGHTWAAATLPLGNAALAKIIMVSATEGWAVGGYCGCGSTQPLSGTPGSLILHYQHGIWSEVTSPSHPLSQYLFDIAMPSATEGWATGIGGTLLHYSGGAWTASNGPTTKGVLSLSLTSATEGWAVGDQGTLLQLQYGAWTLYGGDVERLSTPTNTLTPTRTKMPQRNIGPATIPTATAMPYPR